MPRSTKSKSRRPRAAIQVANPGLKHPLVGTAVVAALTLAADQGIKYWIKHHITFHGTLPVWRGVFHLTHVRNTGAAFSLFYDYPEMLTYLACTFLVFMAGYLIQKGHLDKLELWGFGLVMGGTMGNLADRLMQGAVTDYLDFRIIHYPIFNLADSAIFIGVGLIALHTLRRADG